VTPPVTLGAWFHDLSPFALRISGDFGIRWYGVSYLLGFLAAYLLLVKLAKRNFTPLPAQRIPDMMMLLVAGVVVGGRLGYVFLYDPALLTDFSADFPFWGVLKLTQGGMASHGGFVGVILAAWFISRGFKDDKGNRVGACPPLHVMDLCALVAPLGLAFGRIANFINGELLGKVAALPGETAPWWSVKYPQEIIERPLSTLPQTETQIDQIIDLSLNHLLPGETDWELGYLRILEFIQRGDTALKAQLDPLISARYPTQLMQSFFDGFLVLAVVWFIARKPRTPGVIGATMLVVYALGRIPMDLVRLPDSGISQFGPLTRGQLYSLLMLIAGIAVLLWTRRKNAPKAMGGWGGWAASTPSDQAEADDS